MHGRPRNDPRRKDDAAAAEKAARLRELQVQLLHNHHNRIYTDEAIDSSSKLLEINPEVYTAWNYRKLALKHNLDGVNDPDAVKSAIEGELRIVEMALKTNPKSYGAWHHRKWILNLQLLPADFEREFRLLDLLLKADTRNFHGWSYHRFVAKLKNMPEEEELGFTKKMIDLNFSNYSAWHYRSSLLSHVLKKKAQGFSKEDILTAEYDLVHNALFTDQTDQSGWFYYLWLLDQTVRINDPQLVSSWPVDGSDLVLSKIHDFQEFLTTKTGYRIRLHGGTFPVILYFNRAVKNVKPSTVHVSSSFVKNEDLTWRPLSVEHSEEACCWVAFLKLPDEISSSSSSYPVSISLCRSNEIIASNGSHFKHPSEFSFTVTLSSKEIIEESVEENFVWDYVDLRNPQEGPCPMLFDMLRINKNHEVKDIDWNLQMLSNEMELFREFNEEDSKFVKLILAKLLVAHNILNSDGSHKNLTNHTEEVLSFYDDLMKLDPSHKRYYEDEKSIILMDQLTSDDNYLSKHCWHFDKPTSSSFHHQSCLQLNKLSLTRIGSVKNLLWVQMLDLRNNELRSVSGIEALQLLVCLNLSNNKISSFTALEPLKLISSLKVLDVSFNMIGSHAIDTTRYLCLSPLSHTLDPKKLTEEYKKENTNVQSYWEAILFLRVMRLTQFDVKGNAVVNQNFRALAIESLPTLKWLDGERVR